MISSLCDLYFHSTIKLAHEVKKKYIFIKILVEIVTMLSSKLIVYKYAKERRFDESDKVLLSRLLTVRCNESNVSYKNISLTTVLLWFLSIRTPCIWTIWGKYSENLRFFYLVRPSIRTIWEKKLKWYIFRNFYKTPLFRKNINEEQKKRRSLYFFGKFMVIFMENFAKDNFGIPPVHIDRNHSRDHFLLRSLFFGSTT